MIGLLTGAFFLTSVACKQVVCYRYYSLQAFVMRALEKTHKH